jgi:hypothetical protein
MKENIAYWFHRGATTIVTVWCFYRAVFELGRSGWWWLLAVFILILSSKQGLK